MNGFLAKSKKWIIVAGAALAVIVAVVVILVSLGGKSVDLTNYIAYMQEGFDGTGTLIVELDYVAVSEKLGFEELDDIRDLEDIQKENGWTDEYVLANLKEIAKEHDLELDELRDLAKSFEIEVKNNGSFSNGDIAKITIKVDDDEEYGGMIVGGKTEYEFVDLRTLQHFFPTVETTFSGSNGKGYASCSITDAYEDWYEHISFTYEGDGTLSNGDEVKITATISDSVYATVYAEKLQEGYEMPRSNEFTVTVSGLNSKLTLENCTDAIIDKAEQIVKEDTVLGDPTLVAQVSMVYLAEKNQESYIVVALEFPDPAKNRVWNHVRYLTDTTLSPEGELEYGVIEHVLSGNGFNAAAQENYILTFEDFDDFTLTKLR